MRISDWSSDVCSSDLWIGSFESPVVFASRGDHAPVAISTSRPRRSPCEVARRMPSPSSAIARTSQCSSIRPPASRTRSEEHTSELQSLMRISYAVFCLKKKKYKKKQSEPHIQIQEDTH